MARNTGSNVCNQGIMHWALDRDGGRPACGGKRAHMSVIGEKFATDARPCRRCLAKYNSAVSRTEQKKLAGMIDLTPSWEGLIPYFIASIESGGDLARTVAREELLRLARFADAKIAEQSK